MKRSILFLLSPVIGLLFVSSTLAQNTPNFAPGRYVLGNDVPLNGENLYSSPAVADWNQDGKKDILVGTFYEGRIWLYLNEGTDAEPLFTEGVLLEADGVPISVGFG